MGAVGRLRHRVGQAIAADALWAPGDRVAVAVSGGMDSVALLDLLRVTAGWHGGVLSVVTVDHGTRPGSAADADFVEDLARGWGLPVHRATLDLGSASEARARGGRYGVFDQLDVERVALAHHRGDQAETVLIHLLRGTGITGLSGMRAVRGRYVRPLLGIGRGELAAWIDHRGLDHREDPTNRDPRFLRNRIRHEVLPLLEAIRPGAEGALARGARLAGIDDGWLGEAARAADPGPPWALSWMVATPQPLVRRALLAAVPGLQARQIDQALEAAHRGRGRVMLAEGCLEVRDGRLHVVRGG